MKILIFEETLSGHHLEYLHHYYIGACARTDNKYVFCVPQKEFENKKNEYEWPAVGNICFKWLEDDDFNSIMRYSGNTYLYGFTKARIVAKYAKNLFVQKVLLTNFISSIPMLIWMMPSGVTVSGIVYRIYLYNNRNSLKKWLRYAFENCCYRIMAKSNTMNKIFVLNDKNSSEKLNKIHRSSKFVYLPDPVPQVDLNKVRNIRKELNIDQKNTVYFHFGGLSKRKGTLDILKAIVSCTNENLSSKTFVFAGKVGNEIYDDFYKLLKLAERKTQILVFDEFCSYDFLHNMCYSCNVILMPYHQSNLSSGVLGYAAVFRKPVIGCSEGLVGNLIRKYKMGYCLPHVSTTAIIDSFFIDVVCESTEYINTNDVLKFIDVVLE